MSLAQSTPGSDPAVAEAVRAAVGDAVRAEVAPLFDQLHRFVDRRIAELSAEVDGAVQLADMSEANLSGKLADIHAQIAHVISLPAAATRNSGVELEAVVQATEAAANTILEAAEAIQDFLAGGATDAAALQNVTERVNAIFEACSFQDITGQRIRRAIQHLQQVEQALESMMPPGIVPHVEAGQPAPAGLAAPAKADRVQVNNLMSTVSSAGRAMPDLAQDDIDALLNA